MIGVLPSQHRQGGGGGTVPEGMLDFSGGSLGAFPLPDQSLAVLKPRSILTRDQKPEEFFFLLPYLV